jgi:hypothetical protein
MKSDLNQNHFPEGNKSLLIPLEVKLSIISFKFRHGKTPVTISCFDSDKT